MPHKYDCKTCWDTGRVGYLWWTKPCPKCGGKPWTQYELPNEISIKSVPADPNAVILPGGQHTVPPPGIVKPEPPGRCGEKRCGRCE